MSAYHHHRLPLFIAERKTTCKEATSQDLTDHRALREQLHTIRTASLEERHGRERNWKAEKNVTETENHSTQIYNCADGNQYCKSMTKPQPRTQICTKHIWYWFFEFGSKRSSFNRHSVWILFLMVWADFSPNYLLSSDSSVYFNKLHSNTSSGSAHSTSKSQTKN